jgi:hypothetical protein
LKDELQRCLRDWDFESLLGADPLALLPGSWRVFFAACEHGLLYSTLIEGQLRQVRMVTFFSGWDSLADLFFNQYWRECVFKAWFCTEVGLSIG